MRYMSFYNKALLEEYLAINQVLPGAFSYLEYRDLDLIEAEIVLETYHRVKPEGGQSGQ